MIEQYVDAVTKTLPERDRGEVAKEVRNMISELVQAMPANLTEQQKLINVLEKLGDPLLLADQYRGYRQYLIGPKYYQLYLSVLKIVLMAVFLGISIATIVGAFSNQLPLQLISDYLGNLFEALLQGAAWVTIIFAIMEHNQAPMEANSWKVSDLKPVTNHKAKIGFSEPVFGIVFAIIGFILLYFRADVFATYFMKDNIMIKMPIFGAGLLAQHWLLIAILVVTLVKEGLKLLWGSWQLSSALINSGLTVLNSYLLIRLLTADIFNHQLGQLIVQESGLTFPNFNQSVVVLITFITVLDILTVLYKALRYGKTTG
jgi:hypothetical protein